MSVGRARSNTLRIRDDRIAAHHIRIEQRDSRYVLEVMTDHAPTTLNGRGLSVGTRQTLSDGDRIGLADLEFRFTDDARQRVLCRLRVVAGVHTGKTFRIEGSHTLIGRATDNDVQFPDRTVSRRHCRIHRQEEGWWIEDLGSTNGTVLRGAPISRAEPLGDGDEVVAGFTRFVFEPVDPTLPDSTTEPMPPRP